MKGYVLIDETGGKFPDLTREKLLTLAAALAAQQVELAAWWQRTELTVIHADSEAAAPQDDGWTFMKAVPVLDDPDALAYHTEINGRPLILMGAQIIQANTPAGSDWVLGPSSFATATSHEGCETTCNPYVDFYAPWDGDTWVPLEVCDPTEGDTYKDAARGVYLSNFVGPRWFSDGPGPYDRMGVMRGPREVRAAGYVQKLIGGPAGASSTFWGAAYPAWKRIAKRKAGTRHAMIAARAKGTDALAHLRAKHTSVLEELERLQGETAFHKEAAARVIAMHDAKTDELTRLRAELEQLRRVPRVHGNGGHGG